MLGVREKLQGRTHGVGSFGRHWTGFAREDGQRERWERSSSKIQTPNEILLSCSRKSSFVLPEEHAQPTR